MPNPLLKLGEFSFEGLESPERIHLKANQKIAIHHLGSGLSVTDSLGEDCQTISFRGIFSGTNAAERVRAIDYLRLRGLPLPLIWGSQALSVLIHQFELDYTSELWMPYKLSCYVIRSTNPGAALFDNIFASPATQVADIIDLLRGTDSYPTSDQSAALVALSTLNYDAPPRIALTGTQSLARSINEQVAALSYDSYGGDPIASEVPPERASWFATIVMTSGLEANLILARNRVKSIIVSAESTNQP